MLKIICDVCGEHLKVVRNPSDLINAPSLCGGCEQIRLQTKRSTLGISKVVDSIVAELKGRGDSLISEMKSFQNQLTVDVLDRIKTFEGKILGDLSGQAEKMLEAYFSEKEAKKNERAA